MRTSSCEFPGNDSLFKLAQFTGDFGQAVDMGEVTQVVRQIEHRRDGIEVTDTH